MTNWNVIGGFNPNYDAEQKERTAVFDKIAPKPNWKEPIRAWISEKDFAECNDAAIWFTGTGLTVTKKNFKKKMLLVEGAGYYATIGA